MSGWRTTWTSGCVGSSVLGSVTSVVGSVIVVTGGGVGLGLLNCLTMVTMAKIRTSAINTAAAGMINLGDTSLWQ